MATTTQAITQNPHEQPPQKRDFRQEVTNSIVQMLEKGVAPWQKPWEASASAFGMPMNPTTEKAYRGGNAIHLIATGLRRGYEDPRWMTYKQAGENGWQVRKGEKGTQIEFWEIRQGSAKSSAASPGGGETGSEATGRSEERRVIHRVYTVFNAKQIDGVPARQPKQHSTFEAVRAGEQILENSGAKIIHDQADRAFYSRTEDSIHLPSKDNFRDAAGYYGTSLHELAHWTGHPSRLNRSTLAESYRFGDVNYAKEELRAELASVFLAAERGIPHNPEQHAAYVGSWIKSLKEDKNEIFRAAHDASLASDFLLSLERDRSVADEALSVGPALDSATSSGVRKAAYEQQSANLQRDREDLIDEPISHKPGTSERVNQPLLKQVAARTWEATAALAPEDLIAAAVRVRAEGGTYVIHKNSYLSTDGITKAQREFTENMDALQGSSEPDWKRRDVAYFAGSSFSRLLAELALPRTPDSLDLLSSHEPLISDALVRSSFLNGFADDVRRRRTEEDEIYPGSPESIRRAADREQFIQAMQRKLGREFENTGIAARFEPESGTVKVEDKRTGTERRATIEMHGASAPSAMENQTGKNVELSAVRAITTSALGKSARTVNAFVDAGTYRGAVLGETEHHVVQRLSGSMAVSHQKELLDRQPQVGEIFSIHYSNGKGVVREARERAKINELGR